MPTPHGHLSFLGPTKVTQFNKILTAISPHGKTVSALSEAFQFPTGILPSPTRPSLLRLIKWGRDSGVSLSSQPRMFRHGRVSWLYLVDHFDWFSHPVSNQTLDAFASFAYHYSSMPNSDPQLWQRVLDGDSNAWAIIVKRYQSLIYAVATRSGLSQVDAADCFQQTWILLYNNRKRLQDPTRLSAWLVTTAKREAFRIKRRAGSDPGDDSAIEQVDKSPLQDEELLEIEKQAQLEGAIGQLDDRCRQLVDAFFFAEEEQSYEQIAKSLGIASNSLGPIRRRCLERLKRILEENGFDEVRNLRREPL